MDYVVRIRIADPSRRAVWVKLMSAKERDWVQLYQKFPTELNRYIQSVRYNSLSIEKCRVEIELLRMFFDWEEDYCTDWEIKVSVPPIKVKYFTLEEMLEAETSNSKPEKSAYDSWNSVGRDSEISWGNHSAPRLSITSLRLR